MRRWQSFPPKKNPRRPVGDEPKAKIEDKAEAKVEVETKAQAAVRDGGRSSVRGEAQAADAQPETEGATGSRIIAPVFRTLSG